MGHVFQLEAPGQSIAGLVFKPWDERKRTSNQIQPDLQQKLYGVAGARVAAFQPPALPGSFGLPIQFVIGTTQPFARLSEISPQFMLDALKSGMFIFLDNDLKGDFPQGTVEIDRDKAAQLGLRMSDV